MADKRADFLTVTQSYTLPGALSAFYVWKRGAWGALGPSSVCFAATFLFRWLVSERTLFWQYEKSLAKMDLT